jgi:drug/metabolite transporter (DMT)-like permease
MKPRHSEHWRACFWLVVATLLWGLSFPLIKSIWLVQERLVPDGTSVFFAALAAALRFGLAAVVIALFAWRSLRELTRLEFEQGAGLAVFSGLGILFQMDGLAYTHASTSAFLTQFTCLLIPAWIAFRHRAAPRGVVVFCCVLVLAGIAILSDVRWSEFKLGRGETETLIATVLFTMQILWLERPRYSGNRVTNFTIVMFAGTTLVLAPLVLFTMPNAAAVPAAYGSGAVWIPFGALVVCCTLGAYLLMNRWQPLVTATEAGLIYCVEPVATSLLAMFLPGVLSVLVSVNYANEQVTWRLLAGGALITGANVLLQLDAMRRKPAA